MKIVPRHTGKVRRIGRSGIKYDTRAAYWSRSLISPRLPVVNALSCFRRFWLPVSVSAALVALAGRVPAITDSGGERAPAGAELVLPASYVALSPLSRLLDALTMLSNPQSIALFVSLGAIALAWVVTTRRKARRALWKRIVISLLVVLAGVLALETAAVFLPREMAAVRAADPEVVRVDFHSHTGVSHDVRKSFSAEDRRDWHRSGGFDIAYVTDHVRFGGAVAARASNPPRAGEGTSLLTGVEGRYHRIISIIVLGISETDSTVLNRRGNLLGSLPSGLEPVTMVALPSRHLDSLTTAVLDSSVALPNLAAIELVDAAPRGLSQVDRQEARIRGVASALDLTLVAASNHHGWGRAAAAWNLMRVPGWRALPPDSVGRLIEKQLREQRPRAVEIIRRTRPTVHGPAVAATAPILAYQIIGSLTMPERIVWFAWTWGLTALSALRHRARRTRSG